MSDIEILQSLRNVHINDTCKGNRISVTLTTAIEAIQEKTDRENPQPLTLEQLREREGKPVYLITTGKVGYWGIVRTALVYGDENNICIVCDRNFTFTLDNIEVYDHEPKGVD
nr:hypothetical protein [uncultured Aminipila sp.]